MFLYIMLLFKGGGSGGGGTTVVQTTVAVPPPSAAEEEAKVLNNKLVKAQINMNFDDVDGKFILKPQLQQIRDLEIASMLADQPNIELSRAALNKFLRGDISITPEQQSGIDNLIEASFRAPARQELEKFKEERTQQFTDLAAALGRGPLDPTFQRELTKEIGTLTKDVEIQAGAEAARQSFLLGTSQPLEASKVGQGLQLFRQQLEAQRQVNVQNLQNQLFREAESLAQQRFAQAGVTRTTSTSGGGSGGGSGFGSALGGIGGFLGGIFCWVAEAIYGIFDYRTCLARDFINDHIHTWYAQAYIKHGRTWAYWLDKMPIFKPVVKLGLDFIVWKQSQKWYSVRLRRIK